jgi:hypothetical protein
MSKLACNIVSYTPNPDMLSAYFRTWHLEALLNQAANLVDRCLEDYRFYASLDYAWNEFHFDLHTEEKQVELVKSREAVKPQEQMDLSEQAPESAEASDSEREESSDRESEAEASTAPAVGEIPATTSSVEIQAEAVQRKKELSGPGQPFALNEQRDLTLKRLCRDYEEALNRSCVAYDGLRQFYDHIGLSSPMPSQAETLSESISNLAIWIRDSCEWLARYHQLEQAFTRVVSVRSLLNRNAWTQLKHARDSFSFKLQVPVELFRGYDNCHMRGVGVSLVGEAGTIPWSALVRLPEDAVWERAGHTVLVDQSNRVPCLLGRVENRRSSQPLQLGGTLSWLNASPIGRATQGGLWSIDLFRPLGASAESFGHVEDVLLEISVVATPQKEI